MKQLKYIYVLALSVTPVKGVKSVKNDMHVK